MSDPTSGKKQQQQQGMNRKRPASAIAIGGAGRGRPKTTPTAIPIGRGGGVSATGIAIKVEPVVSMSTASASSYASGTYGNVSKSTIGIAIKSEEQQSQQHNNHNNNNYQIQIKTKFLKIFEEPNFIINGVPSKILKERFRGNDFTSLVPIINELISENRLLLSNNSNNTIDNTNELYYILVSIDVATKLVGVDTPTRTVYQIIVKSYNMGIWTKTIRTQTNIEQQKLDKIFILLEQRKLIKSVKSVNAKSKKIYMCYDIIPSKELTGGVWYSDLEFDYEFINELRSFVVTCIRKLNNSKGISIKQILDTIIQNNVSKVTLSTNEISQLVETLIYDNIIEIAPTSTTNNSNNNTTGTNEVLFVPTPRISSFSEFKWWNSVLTTDFKYRTIKFDDTVTLQPHEPHYHTG